MAVKRETIVLNPVLSPLTRDQPDRPQLFSSVFVYVNFICHIRDYLSVESHFTRGSGLTTHDHILVTCGDRNHYAIAMIFMKRGDKLAWEGRNARSG